MQIFELHFNPKLREGQIFDSFVYEPENIYERKLGGLYIVGELQNILPQNLKFLDELAKVIKRNYYTLSLKTPEKALSQGLKKVNDFLSEEVKRENVSWLGNLNFAVLSFKDFNLIFTKTGDLKILLIRRGQINDIGKNLDLREIEPYPLKIFLNVVSGKLVRDDVILVLTKEVFDFFQQQNLLTQLALTKNFNQKEIKKILPSTLFTKGEGSRVSGICLLVIIKPEAETVKRPKTILFQKEKRFSFSQVFSPFLKPIKAISKLSLPRLPKIKLPIKIPRPPKFCKTKFGWASFKVNKKKLILILVLIFFLFLGFLLFKNY